MEMIYLTLYTKASGTGVRILGATGSKKEAEELRDKWILDSITNYESDQDYMSMEGNKNNYSIHALKSYLKEDKLDSSLSEEMIVKFGESNQLDIVVEELSELTKEVIKYKRKKSHGENFDISTLKEEMADLLVVSEIIFNVLEKNGVTREEVIKEAKKRQTRTRTRYLTSTKD